MPKPTRMNNERTIFGAATLLLVVGAATTLANDENPELDYEHLTKFFRPGELWSSEKCNNLIRYLPQKIFDCEPKEMLKQLQGSIENTEKSMWSDYIRMLISFTSYYPRDVCRNLGVEDFLGITSTLNKIKNYEPYVKFVTNYARLKFYRCTLVYLRYFGGKLRRKLDSSLSKWNELFRAGLNIDMAEMYDRVSKVDLFKHKLDVRAMIEVANKYHMLIETSQSPEILLGNLFQFLNKQCYLFRDLTFTQVRTINVARSIGAIEEENLPRKFRLINEYAYFCARFLNEEDSKQIKANFESWYH